MAGNADGTHDLDAIADRIDDRTRAIIVCSPNNPTGPAVSTHAFQALMDRVPDSVLVILDEAYIDFVTDPEAVRGQELLQQHPNLGIMRTFSKAYGLAGMRVGYMLAAPEITLVMKAMWQGVAITDAAQAAALAALEHQPEIDERVAMIVEQRCVLIEGLRAQGWDVSDSQANVVWLPMEDQGSISRVVAAFEEAGLVVRGLPPHGVRITIGRPESIPLVLDRAAQIRRDALV